MVYVFRLVRIWRGWLDKNEDYISIFSLNHENSYYNGGVG